MENTDPETQKDSWIPSTISSVQSLSRVWLFATPRTAACQASLSITNSWSLLKLMSKHNKLSEIQIYTHPSQSITYFHIKYYINLFWIYLQCRRPRFDPCVRNTPWRRDRLPTPTGSSDRKECACGEGDLGLTPGLGRSPGEGNGNPVQNSCLENPMDSRACWARVRGVAKSQTRLSGFHTLHSE